MFDGTLLCLYKMYIMQPLFLSEKSQKYSVRNEWSVFRLGHPVANTARNWQVV